MPALLEALMAVGALSLALLPSRPSWTNSSRRRNRSSCCSASPSANAEMLASALMMAMEQCLDKRGNKIRNIGGSAHIKIDA